MVGRESHEKEKRVEESLLLSLSLPTLVPCHQHHRHHHLTRVSSTSCLSVHLIIPRDDSTGIETTERHCSIAVPGDPRSPVSPSLALQSAGPVLRLLGK